MDRKLEEMRSESKLMRPDIIVGKNGITQGVIDKIKQELKDKRIVKIKILKAYIEGKDKDEVFEEIARSVSARIVHKIGFTISLTRRA